MPPDPADWPRSTPAVHQPGAGATAGDQSLDDVALAALVRHEAPAAGHRRGGGRGRPGAGPHRRPGPARSPAGRPRGHRRPGQRPGPGVGRARRAASSAHRSPLDRPAIDLLVERVVAPLGLRADRTSPDRRRPPARRLPGPRRPAAAGGRWPHGHDPPLRRRGGPARRVLRRRRSPPSSRARWRPGSTWSCQRRHRRWQDDAPQRPRAATSRRASAWSRSRTPPSSASRAITWCASRPGPPSPDGLAAVGVRDLVPGRPAHAPGPHRGRRGAGRRGPRHAPGDEHGARRLPVHVPRQRPRRRAPPHRDDGPAGPTPASPWPRSAAQILGAVDLVVHVARTGVGAASSASSAVAEVTTDPRRPGDDPPPHDPRRKGSGRPHEAAPPPEPAPLRRDPAAGRRRRPH